MSLVKHIQIVSQSNDWMRIYDWLSSAGGSRIKFGCRFFFNYSFVIKWSFKGIFFGNLSHLEYFMIIFLKTSIFFLKILHHLMMLVRFSFSTILKFLLDKENRERSLVIEKMTFCRFLLLFPFQSLSKGLKFLKLLLTA